MKKANYALTKAKKERDRAEEGWVGPHLTGPRKVWAATMGISASEKRINKGG